MQTAVENATAKAELEAEKIILLGSLETTTDLAAPMANLARRRLEDIDMELAKLAQREQHRVDEVRRLARAEKRCQGKVYGRGYTGSQCHNQGKFLEDQGNSRSTGETDVSGRKIWVKTGAQWFCGRHSVVKKEERLVKADEARHQQYEFTKRVRAARELTRDGFPARILACKTTEVARKLADEIHTAGYSLARNY